MQGPEFGPIGEEQETKKLSKESAIRANVEFWKSLGVDSPERDAREKIEEVPEVEGFDWYIYMPKGLLITELWQKMSEKIPAHSFIHLPEIRMPRTTTESSYAIAVRYSQEPDQDSLGKNAKSPDEWEEEEQNFMTPAEWIVAEMIWHQTNGTHLDQENETIFPNSRYTWNDNVPRMNFFQEARKVIMNPCRSGWGDPHHGIRRVVTKDTKLEQE